MLAAPKLVLCLNTEGVVVVRRQARDVVVGANDASRQGVPVQVRQVLQHSEPSSVRTSLLPEYLCQAGYYHT